MMYACRLLLAFALLVVCSCSGTGSKDQSQASNRSEYGPSYRERMRSANSAMTKNDRSKRSPFEKHVGKSKANREFKTKNFSRGGEFSGLKKFNSGKDNFRTSEFSQSDKKSNALNKTFRGANQQSQIANKDYKTITNRFDGKMSRDNDRVSSFGGNTFNTRLDPVARKAMERPDRPYIKESKDPSYTEEEVRNILQR